MYTYLIGWRRQNLWYYGVRYAANSTPSDLWVKYFTSSKHVHETRDQYGEPDVIQVRRTFNRREDAITWEEKVLKRMNVVEKEEWLNRTANKCIPLKYSVYEHTCEIRRRKSIARIGLKHSEETKKKISTSQLGKPKIKLRGKKRPEHSAKMLGKNNPRAISAKYKGKTFSTLKSLREEFGLSTRKLYSLINTKEITLKKIGDNRVI